MNKKKIEEYLPRAIEALTKCKIADENGDIIKTFRGQISSFGAAVSTGSFKASVAFFSSDSETKGNRIARSKLIQAIDYVISDIPEPQDARDICKCIINTPQQDEESLKEQYFNAAIALKLAMNAYNLIMK